MIKVLTIAGSDSSGGAGIQADLKTIAAHLAYGESVITALTAQNTLGVSGIVETDPAFVAEQLDRVFEDTVPDAVKIGMVSNPAIIEVIAEKLEYYNAKNIVVDPVMVATSGSVLTSDESIDAMKRRLFSLARVITPNLVETERLVGFPVSTHEEMERAAEKLLSSTSGYFLIKGGHLDDACDDYLAGHKGSTWLRGPRIDTTNTHGTGCTLSSAIACNLGAGLDVLAASTQAKEYLTGALGSGMDLGRGSGPLDHMYRFR